MNLLKVAGITFIAGLIVENNRVRVLALIKAGIALLKAKLQKK